jgi:hypothetical protein
MTRLAAQEKGEYYPTPLQVVSLVAQAISVHPKDGKPLVRIFDPCAGEGLAVAHLANALRERFPAETWGVEINPRRAAEAATRLDMVVEAPFEAVAWKPSQWGVASILFLNPPYDFSDSQSYRRLEHFFVEKSTPALETGGLLVYIVPVTGVDYQMVHFLWNWYEGIQVWRFPDGLYEQFRQIVIFGTRRPQKVITYPDTDHPLYKMCGWDREKIARDLPTLDHLPAFSLPVPTTREKAVLFRSTWTGKEIEALVEQDNNGSVPSALRAALNDLYGLQEAETLEPLMPPKRGHIAQVLASGLLGTIKFPGEVLKGVAVKKHEVVSVEKSEDGEENETTYRDTYTTHIVRITAAGVEHYEKPDEVRSFLEKNADRLAALLRERMRPYGNGVRPEEEEVLDQLCRNRKPLPGQDKPGLLPDQRDTIIAATRSIRRHGVCHVVAEMGYGKTTVGLSVIELMSAYPALIICPPHLVDKWVREAEEVIGPEARAVVVESIAELETARRAYRPGDRLIVIINRSRIKLGPGWRPASATRYVLPDKKEHPGAWAHFRKAYREYEKARREYLRSKGRLGDQEREETMRRLADLRRAALEVARPIATCPECGESVIDGHHIKDPAALRKSPQRCPSGFREVWVQETGEMEKVPCQALLYQYYPEVRRWPLADYIRKKMRGFFRVLVADEVHQYKAKESDQGWAFGLLANVIPWTLTLTGTFFGGPSTSIFWLLHRTQADVREQFGFGDEKRWVERYGVQETRVIERKDEDHSYYLGRKRSRVTTSEKPGISPAIVRHILPTTIFRNISDLGLALPPFRDEVVYLEMSPHQGEDYLTLYARTWAWMQEFWPRYTGAWLQWVLSRPNSCFREEVVENPRGDKLVLRPVVGEGEYLPKEEWLADVVRAELAVGRRVLVYVRQTGTRDIRQRLVDILTARAGICPVVLSETIDPRKREEWLKKNDAPVLITNPRLVETGLDLVQYSTAIFYEPDYSLYTLWQACRRVWRLGQTQPVKVYYAVYVSPDDYRPAMEDLALRLMGRKMAVTQLLYGDDVAGALVPEMDDNLVIQIINSLRNWEKIERVGTLFSEDDRTTASPLGSPTRQSLRLATWEEWLAKNGGGAAVMPRRRRAASPPPGQMALPGF